MTSAFHERCASIFQDDIAVLQPLMRKVLDAIPGALRGKVTNIRG